MDPAILHCDCNGFFASVECLDHPAYWSAPMAVAGDPENRSGIILAKNELAKRYHIQTAETVWQALRKCPWLLLAPPHMERYVEISNAINQIYLQYTDQVEPFSIDESFLDVTGSLAYFHTDARTLADTIRARVRQEIGITISVGLSFNKVFAKIASDMKKPDATTEVQRDHFRSQLWPLPIQDMLFVGKAANAMLERHLIYTIGDLARQPLSVVEQLLGKGGLTLWQNANGLDTERVRRYGERDELKSVGNGLTFRRDLTCEEDIRAGILLLSDEIAARLRKSKQMCQCFQVTIKDPQFKSIVRQAPLPAPTYLQHELVDISLRLIHQNWPFGADGSCPAIRSLTLTGTQLVPVRSACEQITLFDCMDGISKRERVEKIEDAIYGIRRKFGERCVMLGASPVKDLGY